jgi:hypothetical protein
MIVAGVTITIDDDAGEKFGAVAPNCVQKKFFENFSSI